MDLSMTATEASGLRNPNRAGTPSPFYGWGERIGMEFTALDLMRSIELRRARNDALEAMLGGSMKPYKALSRIYAGVSEYEPYIVDWLRIFTPIEYDAWDTIREFRLPFYPQYPVHGVILDFADTEKKIAIECDGKNWHDKATDAARDARLASQGWTTYRITGAECRRLIDGPCALDEKLRDEEITEDEHRTALLNWLSNTSEGVITSLAVVHYGVDLAIDYQMASRVLTKHKGAS